MAKIKIKDLTKGMKITEEELEKVRGGIWAKEARPIARCTSFFRPPLYSNYEICQYVQAMACGCPG